MAARRADLELAARPQHPQRLSKQRELDGLGHVLDDLAAVDHAEGDVRKRKRLREIVATDVESAYPTIHDPILHKLDADRVDPRSPASASNKPKPHPRSSSGG